MQIKCTNTGTKRLRLAKFGGLLVEFSKNGFANVSDEVGEYLVRKYHGIEKAGKVRTPQSTGATRKTRPKTATAVDGANEEGE